MKTRSLVAMLIAIAAGCGSDSRPSVAVTFLTEPSPSASGTPTASAPTAGSTIPPTTVTPASAAPPASAALGRPSVSITRLGTFDQPVGFTWRPTDKTSYVVEQAGRVVIMNDGQPGTTALEMTGLTEAGGERGLLGLAINNDGTLAYVDYTDNDGNTAIDEYAINGDGTFNATTRRNVLAFDQPYPNHNGGELVFGPDHLLYIGTGDGGGAGDPERRALDLGQWLGKILRIDPRKGNAAYTVPSDNPFVGIEGALPEIWSVGLRNPWRFSFDRQTKDLWIADVGQDKWEEVDVAWAADGAGRGMNFGWSAWEGNHRYNDDQSPDGATAPIYEYPHGDAGCSISGGVRYRGTAIPALDGWYVYGDYCSGQVRALQIVGSSVADEMTLGKVPSVSAVTEAPDGELLVLSVAGPIYALTPA
ncbi:MAG: PQQ-dependent sugar dehydrogenase [Ilumatobacteraceae bacterium]